MASSPRIKGQAVLATVSGPVGIEDFTARSSLDLAAKMEILEEAYIGETTNRYDDIFNGISGSLEIHIERVTAFDFVERIIARARRRAAASDQYNILVRFSLPNGTLKRLLFEDIFFGEVPINTAGRPDYVTMTIPFEGSTMRSV